MRTLVLVLIFVIAGCTSTASNDSPKLSDTMEIIKAAAASAPKGVDGEYTLQILATGIDGQFVYLNTEKDYRDQRALTVALHPRVISQLSDKYGVPPQDFFVDKTIVVKGKAQRIKIAFLSEGKPTSKYYYQTHIRVMESSQLKLVDELSQI